MSTNPRPHPQHPIPAHDKTTMLLDLLAGWAEFTTPRREAASSWHTYRTYQPNPTRADYHAFSRHYNPNYEQHLHDLYQRAATDTIDTQTLTPRQFLERHVLPLFDEPQESEATTAPAPPKPQQGGR